MTKIYFLFLLFFVSVEISLGQDCKEDFLKYSSHIDTTIRPVYFVVDDMPEFFETGNFMKFMREQKELFDSLKCCPFHVHIALILEPDSTLSNIEICTKMEFCDENIIEYETEKFDKKLFEILKKVKTTPGKLKGKGVAVTFIFPIHYECFDWGK